MATKQPTNVGTNRTGIAAAPRLGPEMIKSANEGSPAPSREAIELMKDLRAVRADYTTGAEPVGTMPPPSSVKGAAKAALEVMKAGHPNVYLDQLGDRLAFERTGTRLYDALLQKREALGNPKEEPTADQIRHVRDEETKHFEILRRTMEELGADPTAVTPTANLSAVASTGLITILGDPRTTMDEALHAVHIAELADNDGWTMLIELAEAMGHENHARRFREALREEAEHLAKVRGWMKQRLLASASAFRSAPGT